MVIAYATSIMRPSANGWRLTFFDVKGEPVASFWAIEKHGPSKQARAAGLTVA